MKMKKNEMYVVQLDLTVEYKNGRELYFYETKEELVEKLTELSTKKTKTNQSYLYFSRVYGKGSLHPLEHEEFYEYVDKNMKNNTTLMGDYIVQFVTKKDQLIDKQFGFREEFDYLLEEWKEKYKEVIILNENLSYSAEYYYDLLVKKQWGQKKELFA
jgi:hypothetical protein